MQNAECKMQNRRRAGMPRVCFLLLFCILHFSLCIQCPAVPSQSDVFKSIKENVSETEGSGKTMLAVAVGAVAVVLLLVLLNYRSKRQATRKPVNHQGRLLKEIAKRIGLRPAELRQLKLLADAERRANQPIESPLVFLLCPSVFTSAMRAQRVKVDRKIMGGIARKLGLIAPAKAK
jgi:hypothetical protein